MMLQPDFLQAHGAVDTGTSSTCNATVVGQTAGGMQNRRSSTDSCSSFADVFSDEQNMFLLKLANDVFMEDLEDSSCYNIARPDDEWKKSLAAPSINDDAMLSSQHNDDVLNKNLQGHLQRVSFGTVQIYETMFSGDKEYTKCTKTTIVKEHHPARLRAKSTNKPHPFSSSSSPTLLARHHCWTISKQQHDALFSSTTSCGPIVPKYHPDAD